MVGGTDVVYSDGCKLGIGSAGDEVFAVGFGYFGGVG